MGSSVTQAFLDSGGGGEDLEQRPPPLAVTEAREIFSTGLEPLQKS